MAVKKVHSPLPAVVVSCRILEEQEMELADGGGGEGKKGATAYGAENLAGLKVCVGVCAFC